MIKEKFVSLPWDVANSPYVVYTGYRPHYLYNKNMLIVFYFD